MKKIALISMAVLSTTAMAGEYVVYPTFKGVNVKRLCYNAQKDVFNYKSLIRKRTKTLTRKYIVKGDCIAWDTVSSSGRNDRDREVCVERASTDSIYPLTVDVKVYKERDFDFGGRRDRDNSIMRRELSYTFDYTIPNCK